MKWFETAREAFAVGGLGLAVWAIYNWLKRRPTTDDAPIRVKGGSIEVMSRIGDWQEDLEEKDREFSIAGKGKGWKALVWKNLLEYEKGEAAATALSGRRIIVKVDVPSGDDYSIVFRANGGVRVFDEEKKLVLAGSYLRNDTANHRIKAVIAKSKGKDPDEYNDFDKDNKGYIELWPL